MPPAKKEETETVEMKRVKVTLPGRRACLHASNGRHQTGSIVDIPAAEADRFAEREQCLIVDPETPTTAEALEHIGVAPGTEAATAHEREQDVD